MPACYVPSQRRLRVFALDPSFSQQLDAAALNEMAVSIRWEKDLKPGPVGEYFEVQDRRHKRVDLNDPALLAQDGLAPAVGNAQFHQQMVYAVAMRVVENVERALGRPLLWNPLPKQSEKRALRSDADCEYRLRLVPHAIKEANAYYSPEHGALIFGYVPAKHLDAKRPEGETIYTCLSHDIIAHELTHVVIHSLLPQSVAPTGPDAFAFHEAVADLVAIFQHFEISPMLEDAIRKTQGDLSKQHFLADLAVEFGRAQQGDKRALRSALGGEPDAEALAKTLEPHPRGAIMVAAVFDAFLAIYNHRVEPLLRIATNGTGKLPPGDPHPDLVKRMAAEASDTARRMLDLLLRALDYCPPIDITFSDYLRALVTADYEHAAEDRTFRLAITEAFRRRGIVAEGTRGVSAEAIRWPSSSLGFFLPGREFLDLFSDCWRHGAARQQIHLETNQLLAQYHRWLHSKPMSQATQRELGLAISGGAASDTSVRVQALRPTRRITQGHELHLDWVIQIVQSSARNPDFFGGCTVIVDANTGEARYAIAKDIRDGERFERLRHAAFGEEVQTPETVTERRFRPRALVEPVVVRKAPVPLCRRLRTYAFDPTLSWQIDTAVLNQTTLSVKWEDLERGPVGEYLEVIDYDPASKAFYAPIDLNDPGLLAQDGLAPSEGSPQFHQQMVYAVAMNTIAHFERALGRKLLWSTRGESSGRRRTSAFVRRLRLYPHALRQPNAYYDAEKKAILFGYFPASTTDPGRNLPGGMVFTSLSQDIIAHETTHAILDGIHCRYLEPTNADALAFHEAFADIVALFQHFSHAEALSHQIAKTRGDLTRQNLLGELAQQFGEATGRYGALRSAIGQINLATKQWEPIVPDPSALQEATEAHERGAILVAAVFDTFLTIYKSRVTDLIRIATGGTGRLPEGDIHPDLVARLAVEAGKAATHVLQMCVRALDYSPPFDITFGEFLRAIITADYDLMPDDPRGYRIAVVEAFRRRGIHPSDVRTLSEDSLRWSGTDLNLRLLDRSKGQSMFEQVVKGWRLDEDRKTIFDRVNRLGTVLQRLIHRANLNERQQRQLGIVLGAKARGIVKVGAHQRAAIEVHSVRRARRISPDGQLKVDLVIELTQKHLRPYTKGEPSWPPFRGGCTLIADPDSGQVRYCISKDILSGVRLERQKEFLNSAQGLPLQAAYFGDPRRQPSTAGLLAMLHEGDMQ